MTMISVQHRDDVRHALVQSRFLPRLGGRPLERAFDLVVSSLAILVFLPLMMVVAVMVAMERRGPVLFRHERIGHQGRRFEVYKFRSMMADGDAVLREHLARDPEANTEWARDHKLRHDPRVTPLGHFLRKSSLDELPQLVNVLSGAMSMVGPRPIVEAEVFRYGKFFASYCSVKPGITGVWQTSGRNDVTYRRRVLMDALYARRKTVLLDAKLLLLTIPAVLVRKGSY